MPNVLFSLEVFVLSNKCDLGVISKERLLETGDAKSTCFIERKRWRQNIVFVVPEEPVALCS